MRAANDSGLHELNVECDSDFIADENAAGFECGAPGEAVVFTVNFGGRRKSYPGIAPGIFRGRSRPFNYEIHISRHTVDGEVARNRQFSVPIFLYPRGFERKSRMLFNMEEVRALQ